MSAAGRAAEVVFCVLRFVFFFWRFSCLCVFSFCVFVFFLFLYLCFRFCVFVLVLSFLCFGVFVFSLLCFRFCVFVLAFPLWRFPFSVSTFSVFVFVCMFHLFVCMCFREYFRFVVVSCFSRPAMSRTSPTTPLYSFLASHRPALHPTTHNASISYNAIIGGAGSGGVDV